MGDGFFTQTAVIGNGSVEELIFPQPRVPEVNAYASSRQNLALRISGETGSDEVALRTQESSAGALAYEIGRDGIKFMSMNSDVPQIYIANPSTGTRFSLAAAVDETALTPIGVYVADSGMYTIDLPDGTIAEDYDVILLTDNATGQITDLRSRPIRLPPTERAMSSADSRWLSATMRCWKVRCRSMFMNVRFMSRGLKAANAYACSIPRVLAVSMLWVRENNIRLLSIKRACISSILFRPECVSPIKWLCIKLSGIGLYRTLFDVAVIWLFPG